MRSFAVASFIAAAVAAPAADYGYGYQPESSVVGYPVYTPTPSSSAYVPKVTSSSSAMGYPVYTPSSSAIVSKVSSTSSAVYKASSSSVMVYPVYTPSSSAKAASSTPVSKASSSYAMVYPVYTPSSSAVKASSTPVAPQVSSTSSCPSSVTVTVTVPYSAISAYPVPPKSTATPVYPISSVSGYPVVPAPSGTGYSTGSAPKPTYTPPTQYTGAASSLNAAGFVAGVGAFAAFFL